MALNGYNGQRGGVFKSITLGAPVTSLGPEGQAGSQGPRVFRYDTILALQNCAPLWCAVLSFDCRESTPQQKLVTAERMVDLYANKSLSRSTLVVGIMAPITSFEQVPYLPAAFFRPLEFVLELLDAGNLYRPLTLEEVSPSIRVYPTTTTRKTPPYYPALLHPHPPRTLTPHTHAHSPCPQVQQGQPPANWSLPLHAMVRPNNIVGLASLQQQESPMTKVPYW